MAYLSAVNVVAAVSICILLANPSNLFVLAKGKRREELTFYVHENRTIPGATVIFAVPEGGTVMADVRWGSVIIVDNVVREGYASDSKYLGRVLGSIVVGMDNVTMHVSYTYVLNTTSYQGSITAAGILQTGKLVVTGGTDSFSFVKGVASLQILLSNASAAIYKYELSLKY